MSGYDPVRLSDIVERNVVRREGEVVLRRYWRFRASRRWYGGVATADTTGCNLRCRFCGTWLGSFSMTRGDFYSPEQVARKLLRIARRVSVRYIRISGGEPTIGWEHLIQVLEHVRHCEFTFILETNGILIGHKPERADELSEFPNLHVRVSIKGACEEEFARLTGARPEFFRLQIRAIENLLSAGVSFHPAVVASFSPPERVRALAERLAEIHPELPEALEIEYIVLYPPVVRMLQHFRIVPIRAYTTDWELIDTQEYLRRFGGHMSPRRPSHTGETPGGSAGPHEP